MKFKRFFLYALLVQFLLIIPFGWAKFPPCECYTSKNPEYVQIVEDYGKFIRMLEKHVMSSPGNGYLNYEWERKYYNAYYPLRNALDIDPTIFSAYQGNLLLKKQILEIVRLMRLESNAFDYSKKRDKYLNGISHIEKSYWECRNAFNHAYSSIVEDFDILHRSCMQKHKKLETYYQHGLLQLIQGNSAEAAEMLEKTLQLAQERNQIYALDTHFYENLGVTFIEGMAYEKAVEALTEAIKQNPKNKDAYFQRAAAYFELGEFDLSLADYLSSEKSKEFTNKIPLISLEFQKGALAGVLAGSKEAAIEFFPSMFSSIYGASTTAWAGVQDPVAFCEYFCETCQNFGFCVGEYLKTLDKEKLEGYALTLKEKFQDYEKLPDQERGKLFGYIVGRYGADIVVAGAAIEGTQIALELKNANRLCNLEVMAASQANKEKIIAKALTNGERRHSFFENSRPHLGAQGKHIRGHPNYENHPNRDILSVFTHSDPESLLKKYAGFGQPVREGMEIGAGYKERVDFGENIGIFKDLKTGKEYETTIGIIHYNKEGLAHIVPAAPKKL